MSDDFKIVYTPLHGTGAHSVKRILTEIGFKNIFIVKDQELPDGRFPTVDYPNPEDPSVFKLALKLAREVDADIVLANDPDADRLGIYAKNTNTGEYSPFTGNMSAALIAEYLLSQKKEKGILDKKGALITTIVSTNMAEAIAKEYDIKFIEVLTGFKFIGEQMKLFEQNNTYKYQFGFEEAYGCLIGTHARDKDGVVAVLTLCEAGAFYKKQGLTLCDQMENIYKKYGYYKEDQKSIVLKGVDGAEKIKNMLEKIRNNPPTAFGEYEVVCFRDYKTGKVINLKTGEETSTNLPKSDVLYFELEEDAWICIRPSGTEPKVKLYVGVKDSREDESKKRLEKLAFEAAKLME